MAFPSEIFRSYDIRGKLDQVTPDIARAVGESLVRLEGAKTIVVGRDMRATSPELAAAAMEAIAGAGGNVIDIGMCTTSMFNYAIIQLSGVDIGMMVTASHNPADYNGIKVGRRDSRPVPGKELLEMVEKVGEEKRQMGQRGQVESKDLVVEYLDHVLAGAPKVDLSGAKIVIDYGNGMGVVSVRPLMERLGAVPVELYPEPDARFPNHEANPAIEETLHDLQAKVKEVGADLGIALDGDVDRVKFVDENGQSVQSDHLLALLAQTMLTAGDKAVLAMNLSRATHEAVAEAGGEVIEAKIGRTNIISEMLAGNAALGGEFSGHFMFRQFGSLECVDYAIVQVLTHWKESGKKMSELVAPFRRYANTGEINLEVHDKAGALARVKDAYAATAQEVSERDGIRCRFADWWFILRQSNTEPVVRLTVEANSQELLSEKRDELVKMIMGT